jgi:saccharopine dehydrogenase-like NADP-dependent oxidoreductase
MKNVLILGAGMVARPIIRYLLENGIQVTVASNTPERGEKMIAGHSLGKNVSWSVEDHLMLDSMVRDSGIVVSLLPFQYHLQVAGMVLKHRKNLLTTSYVKPEMAALDNDAKKAGIIILNEMGLDPGIDHMTAMRIIDTVHGKGGKIEEFYSLCGALCAPEAATNPFRYRFSWSPKGVVMASNNDAKFLKQGVEVNLRTNDLFKNPFKINFPGVGQLEVYPNRDSISYIDIYGIQEVKTMYRGTFRFPGWCETFDIMKRIKLISADKIDMTGMTYAGLVAFLIGEKVTSGIRKTLADYLCIDYNAVSLDAIEFLGLFDDRPLNRAIDTPFEVTSDLMIEKMMITENERDMVVMQHNFLASYPDGNKEVIRSRMLDFGIPGGDTSIARTVALPAAVGVKMILENKISLKGVYRPVVTEIYEPVLDELEKMNIRMKEEFGLNEKENLIIN